MNRAELSPCFTLGLDGAFHLQGAEGQSGSGHNWPDQSCSGRDYKIHSAAQSPCELGGYRLSPSQRPPRVWGYPTPTPKSPLCNVFDSAHVIVQIRGRSGPCGSGHIWTTPTQVLFVVLLLFASRH